MLRDARAVCFTSPIERDSAVETVVAAAFGIRLWVSFGTSAPVGDAVAQRAVFLARYSPVSGAAVFFFSWLGYIVRRVAIC